MLLVTVGVRVEVKPTHHNTGLRRAGAALSHRRSGACSLSRSTDGIAFLRRRPWPHGVSENLAGLLLFAPLLAGSTSSCDTHLLLRLLLLRLLLLRLLCLLLLLLLLLLPLLLPLPLLCRPLRILLRVLRLERTGRGAGRGDEREDPLLDGGAVLLCLAPCFV